MAVTVHCQLTLRFFNYLGRRQGWMRRSKGSFSILLPLCVAVAVNIIAQPILAGFLFALGLGGLALGVVLGQEQLAQDLEIAAQHAQANVTLVAFVALVAAALLAIARLQGTDR